MIRTGEEMAPISCRMVVSAFVSALAACAAVACGARTSLDLWQQADGSAGSAGAAGTGGSDGSADATPAHGCAVQVSAGSYHTCAVRTDGTLWCWGPNTLGEVGDGTIVERDLPVLVSSLGASVARVSAGGNYTCAVKTDGTLWCWGITNDGRLGNGATTGQGCYRSECEPSPMQVTSLGASAVRVSAAWRAACARKIDGTLWCWGTTQDGLLGNGQTTGSGCLNNWCEPSPVQVRALGTSVADVSVGLQHACARTADGALWCWGYSGWGQLGNGTTTGSDCYGGCSASPVRVTLLGTTVLGVATGHFHTCAVKTDGTLWCWGNNEDGELGDGTSAGQACLFGSLCRPAPVQVDSLRSSVVAVSAGGSSTCAIRADGTLWCWGDNYYGQLGHGSTSGQPCERPNTTRTCVPSPVQVSTLGTSVVQVSVGYLHTCALDTEGTVWCWGLNAGGGLGDGTTTPRDVPVRVSLPCP